MGLLFDLIPLHLVSDVLDCSGVVTVQNVTSPNMGVRIAAYVSALLGPPVLILLLSTMAFGDRVSPDFVQNIPKTDLPVNLFVGMSSSMITISAGLAVSTIVVFRLALRPSKSSASNTLTIFGMLAAFLSTYSGLRFQYDLAQQLRFIVPNFDPVLWRLHVQGLLLVTQVSIISIMGLRFHFHKDRRHAPD